MASVINFLPLQDLNGYDHPWPQGGSKNLFDPWDKGYYSPSRDYFVGDSNNITSKPVYLTAGTVVTLSQTDNSKDYSFEEWSICPQSRLDFKSEFLLARVSNVTSGASRTYTVQNDSYVTFRINYKNSSIEEEKPQAEIGSEATEYIPCSNICPITAPVHIVGKNLFNKDDSSNIVSGFQLTSSNGGLIAGSSTSTTVKMPCEPNQTYTVSKISTERCAIAWSKSSNPIVIGEQVYGYVNRVNTTVTTITTGESATYLLIYLVNTAYGSVTAQEVIDSLQVELGSEPTAYEPYTETPVYGGYLDIGNGEVVEEWTHISGTWGNFGYGADLGTCTRKYLDLTQTGNREKGTALTDISGTYLISNSSDTIHYYLNQRGVSMYCIMPTDTDEDTVVSFAYPLATPIHHTLNSAQLAHIMAELNVRYSSMLESRRRILMSSPHVEKLTTETAFFKTDLKAPLKECKISFTPVQEGSGDPSPTNIRPINCWTKVNVGQTRKNIAEIVGYSATNGESIVSARKLSNSYGTTIDTIDYVASHGEVAITQSQWPRSDDPKSYSNGYFAVYVDNLVFGKYYTVSFKISNITNNPLGVNNIVLGLPSGTLYASAVVDGERVIWQHIQWKPGSNVVTRSNFEIRNCGMSFTMSDFMVTAEDEEDQTYESYIDTDIIPITFPFATRNHINIIGYSTSAMSTPKDARKISGSHGTTLSTIYPENILTITQEQWDTSRNKTDYRNGYFDIVTDSLEFGKKYILSFKVNEIINDPLSATVEGMILQNPQGGGNVHGTMVGDRLVFSPLVYTQYAVQPTRTDLFIRNCGISMTISDIMVTEEDETDQTYVPFKSNFYGGYVDLVKGEIVAEWEAIDCLWKDYVNTSTKDEYGMTRRGFDFVNPVQGYGVTGESRDMFCNVAPKNYTDVYEPVHFYVAGTNNRAYVYLPTETDENTRIVVVARLKEPIHHPIDPVTIKTLKGINTIWADANGSMDLSYWTH